MQFSNFILATIISAVLAAPAPSGPGFVSLPIARKKVDTSNLSKRFYDATLTNKVNQYVVNVQIGTPAQEFELLLDTGSSDLWVYGVDAGFSSNYYNASASTTSHIVEDQLLNITYVKGSAIGPYYVDNVEAADATVYQQQFGVVSTNPGANAPGILGISYTGNVADQISPGEWTEYNNFPANLVAQGLISHNAYSLFLDNLQASTGSLIFGGKDTAKYSDPMFTVPFSPQFPDAFYVDVSVEGYNGQFVAALDSGTSLTYVPDEIASAIAADIGARWDPNLQVYIIDGVPEKSLTYDFGNGQIVVPGSELAIPGSDVGYDTTPYVFSVQNNGQTKSYNLLGDTFLRSAYVVYDLDANTASIAQASYSSESNIVPI